MKAAESRLSVIGDAAFRAMVDPDPATASEAHGQLRARTPLLGQGEAVREFRARGSVMWFKALAAHT